MSRARSAHTDNLQVGESIPFFGPAEEAITAPGGDICALWIPVEGVVGFVQLPELLQLPADPAPSQYSTEAKVLKVSRCDLTSASPVSVAKIRDTPC